MAWVNSAALRAAGIDAATAHPAGGRISRDARGRADGMLFETACALAYDRIPAQTPTERAASMAAAQTHAWQVGLTGIHDFDRRDAFVAFQQLRAEHKLGLRVVKHVPVEQLDEAIALGLRNGFGDDWLRIGNIKIFIDGALGPRTASMLAPYANEPANFGMQLMDKEELADKASRASAAGLPITVHAIGDRANHEVLDVLEAVRQEEARRGETPAMRRHRIEHVQLLHAADAGRLGALGIVASMQPIHALGDMASAERYWGARCAGAYAWRTQLQSSAVLAFGSDAPVESHNPFYGLHAAVTRTQPDAAPGAAAWYPEQCLTLAEALAGYTSGAAYAAGMEDRLGTLQPGWLADLIVVDRDIFQCAAHELRATQVVGTIVGGEWKHRLPELD
jgi:predicted amidohydrolase YtcJ